MRRRFLVLGMVAMMAMGTTVGCVGNKQSDNKKAANEQTTKAEQTTQPEETTEAEQTTKEETNLTGYEDEHIGDTNKIKLLSNGETFEVDLDGDGKMEEVSYTSEEKEEEIVKISVNGDVVVNEKFYFSNYKAAVIDINTSDKEKEILFVDNGASDDPTARVYRYTDGKTEEILCVGAYVELTNHDTFIKRSRNDWELGTGYKVAQEYAYENGKFTSVDTEGSSTEMDLTNHWILRGGIINLGELFTYADTKYYEMNNGEMKEAGTIPANTSVKITKALLDNNEVDKYGNIEYAYCETKDGACGWIYLGELEYEDMVEVTEDVYKNTVAISEFWKDTYPSGSATSNGILYPIYLCD